MAEYIEREAAKRYLAFGNACPDTVLYLLDEVDAADVVPVVHGEWEEYPDWSHLRCKNCKIEFERIKMPRTRYFCPNCGADMRERKGDDAR